MGSVKRFIARRRLRSLYRTLPSGPESQIRRSLSYTQGVYGSEGRLWA